MNLSLRKRIRKISSSFKKTKKDGEKGRIITSVESPAKIENTVQILIFISVSKRIRLEFRVSVAILSIIIKFRF